MAHNRLQARQAVPPPHRMDQGMQQQQQQQPNQLVQMEALAEQMYAGKSQEERAHAQNSLVGFTNQVEYLAQCRFILSNSSQQYALMLASSSLLKLVTAFWNSLTKEQILQLVEFILAFVAERFESAPDFVLSNMLHTFARITKLGWLQHEELKDVFAKVQTFARLGPLQYILSLQLLDDVVSSFNQPVKGQSAMVQRKVAVSFREYTLLDVFKLAVASLKDQAQEQGLDNSIRSKLRRCALELTLSCLKFDYIGTNSDESSEDFGSLQIPSAWRPLIEDESLLELLFGMAFKPSYEEASVIMEILVQLASCRRSLFTDSSTRKVHLGAICASSARIAGDQQNYLVNEATYTQFCRLLLALKANYQLQELVKLDAYEEWIHSVTQFSVMSFANWEQTGYSVHYLVTLWARLVMSIAYVGTEFETFLDEYVPRICQAYIETRVKLVERSVLQESTSDMFDENAVETHLQYLHLICRHKYSHTYSLFQALLTPLGGQYREMLQVLQTPQASQLNQESAFQLTVVEYKLAWLIYAIAAIVSGNSSSAAGTGRDEQLDIDAKFIGVAIEVIQSVNLRMTNFASFGGPEVPEALQLAILQFFQQIRKAHIGYDAYARNMRVLEPSNEPEIYGKLSEYVGRPISQGDMLTHIIQEVVRALEFWASSERVVLAALTLLSDLSTGHGSSRLMQKLDCCQALLTQHGSQYFSFMNNPKLYRFRSDFYLTWGRLALTSKNLAFFDEYMRPFEQDFEQLAAALNSPNNKDTQKLLVCLARDLRGVACSIYLSSVFEEFFDWLNPRLFQVLAAAFSQYMDSPQVAIPILRFLAEYSLNQANRIDFSASSPNGIILFKEVVGLLELYSERMVSLVQSRQDLNPDDRYKAFVKPLSLTMEAFKNCLSGGYVNFGVFSVYNDDCLKRVFSRVVQFLGAVGLGQVKDFQKALKNYFALAECLFRDHLDLLAMLDTSVFLTLLNSLQEGIFNEDSNVATQSACAIDHFFTFMHAQTKKKQSADTLVRLQQHIGQAPDLPTQFLASLINLIIFEGVPNMWAFSRPVLALIVVNESGFNQYMTSLIGFQPAQKQAMIAEEFNKLMKDITHSLDAKNRDNFTQQLIFFAVAMKKIVVKPPAFA